MRRRSFLGWACAAVGAIIAGRKVGAGSGRNLEPVVFFVAGARFQVPNDTLQPGEQVTFVADRFGSAARYAIFARENKIGYVPKSVVAAFSKNANLRGQLITIDPNAVPWKKFLVAAWEV